MNRRGFFGSLVAAVTAAFVRPSPVPKLTPNLNGRLNTGYIYAPYIPLYWTEFIVDPDNLKKFINENRS